MLSFRDTKRISKNVADTTFKDEATNFDNDIAKNDNFESFKYYAKILRNTVAQPPSNAPNGVIENMAIVVPLKYLSNFLRSLEISLVNCKVY